MPASGDMSRVTTGAQLRARPLRVQHDRHLLTQDDQVRCSQNAARHLAGEDVFVLECRVPAAPARPGHQYLQPDPMTDDKHIRNEPSSTTRDQVAQR